MWMTDGNTAVVYAYQDCWIIHSLDILDDSSVLEQPRDWTACKMSFGRFLFFFFFLDHATATG